MRMITIVLIGLVPLAVACRRGERTPEEPHRVTIQAASYAFQPSNITVPRGPVRFIVVNMSDIVHAFEVEGQGLEEETGDIQPASTDSLTVTFDRPGEYVIYCPVDDHRERGMTGTLTVQ